MNAEVLSTILSALVAIGGGVAWLVRRWDQKKDPIPRTSAELAVAQQALGIIQDSRDTLVNDVERLKADREADRARIAALEHRQGKLESLLGRAAAFIEVMLRWAHAGSPPPPPVLPPDLYDLIDPSLHTWVQNVTDGADGSSQ